MAAHLSVAELTQQLDYLLSPVLSSRRTAAPLAELLAPLDRIQQDFVLHWVEVIDRSNYEMAYQFAAAAPAALAKMDTAAVEAWILQALDTYDSDGLYRGSQVFKQIDAWLPFAANEHAATFEQLAPVLELYACGLAGRRLQLDVAAEPYTDTETLYLPPRIAVFADAAANFNLYKVIITLLWAQGRYGTFHTDIVSACAVYADPEHATTLLSHFETLRLESCIATVLPGVTRDLVRLRGDTTDPRCAVLQDPAATVQDSLKLLAELYDVFAVPALPHHTALRTEATTTRNKRLQRERSALAEALAQMLPKQSSDKAPEAAAEDRIEIEAKPAPGAAGNFDIEIRLDGLPVAPPDPIAQLLDSILQDLGEIPDDYLRAADSSNQTRSADNESADIGKEIIDEETGIHLYNEWDHKRRHYRKDWCVLRELDVIPVDNRFVEDTLARYRPQVAQLKRTFEMLRDEDRLLKRQNSGDDIDFDALVAGYADLKSGMELPDQLLTRRHKTGRDLAALFMVDMSGSTKGWINDAERESLVMLCEALEVLGDRYAIYGFSGVTRKRCEIFRIKRFDEPYDSNVKRRIAGITPQDYTRMGVAIRHLTKLLNEVDARTRLLVTLSDGKPDDYSDHYRGEYGIEDTRQALIEAQHTGIKPFCITIDHEARDYLPHLYGPVNWTLVDNVERLPLKVADVYRRLTT